MPVENWQNQKDATPQVQLVNGQADIAYSMVVKNNGPNQAHNVVVSDAAPSGVTFLAVTTQPVNGSCSVTPALLNCSLGTLAGYFAADMFIQALKKAGKSPTQQTIQKAAAKMTYEVKNVIGPVKYPAAFTQGSPCAQLAKSNGTGTDAGVVPLRGSTGRLRPLATGWYL